MHKPIIIQNNIAFFISAMHLLLPGKIIDRYYLNTAADYLFILTGLIRCEKVSEPIFHLPFSLIYTSVTIKGLVTSFPPTPATKSISFSRIAVLPNMFTTTE